ncbi:MAG: SDR family NAD(P)-dependent oxidoreductase, partial [Deltaproteobacteria bacterium]|nr:SDR family NAD(P)-dependent oxidoreductase [Deltaproteobacteria bacterium]
MPHDWNLDQVPDLSGRVMIVTGANSGIGYEAALAFAKRKADVILACRNQDKAKAAADRIQNEAPTARLELIPLDLSDLSSVQAFALSFREGHSRLNGLINNAGVMALPKRTTTDGFEMQLGTNHLGHFALTGRLLDLLLATPGSRVVNVSSIAHKFGKIRFHDLQSEKSYSKWGAYGQSKLANLLFTHE